VRATTLHSELLDALQPYVRELVIAAPDRPWLGALIWLDPVVCAGAGWRKSLLARLRAYNAQAGGSSTRLLRLLPLVEPPSAVAGEITDKDTIVARRVLERRASDVARLYAEPADPEAIVAGR
jgi:feruloyl-CoA synthase